MKRAPWFTEPDEIETEGRYGPDDTLNPESLDEMSDKEGQYLADIEDEKRRLELINQAKEKAYAALKPLTDYLQNTPAWLTAYREAFQFCEITMMARDVVTMNPLPYADATTWPLDRIEAVLGRADSPFSADEKTALLEVLRCPA